MNYEEGVRKIKGLIGKTGNFIPYEGIKIVYPGTKGKGDYQMLDKDDKMPKHEDIATELHKLVESGDYSSKTIIDLLIDIHSNGTDSKWNDRKLEYLQYKIFWITLQEEVNYPRSKGCAGINLAFCRFYEAIIAALPNSDIRIEEVRVRCNNRGCGKPILFDFDNAPNFYRY